MRRPRGEPDDFVEIDPVQLARLREYEQLMSGIMGVIDRQGDRDFLFSQVDWAAVGITQQKAEIIWMMKKTEREEFYREIEERQRRAQLKAELIASLTKEQLDLLGVKHD